MKAIILAAGYATRLGKLTENTPKALLLIKNKPILNYLIEQIQSIKIIDEAIIVSNAKFFDQFVLWRKNNSFGSLKITVLNDNTTSNEDRLGAIGDMNFAIKNCKINEETMVAVSDNFFTFKLLDFYKFFKKSKTNCLLGQKVYEKETLKRIGVVTLDDNNFVTSFEEKPQNPKGNTGIFGIYFYTKLAILSVPQYLKEGGNKDAPGHFARWVSEHYKTAVYIPNNNVIIDIGTPEEYEKLK